MYVVAVDVGTTKMKACLFEVNSACTLIAETEARYDLYPMPNGGMEQDHDQWWQALCQATKELLKKSGIAPEKIAGFSICAQMLGMILVDKDCVPVRRPMNYLDRRAEKQWKKGICSGFRIAGYNIRKTLWCLLKTLVAPLDVGDPLWRYKWVEENEPENFARACKWLDVKDYLNARCTGRMAATEDSAFLTGLYENKAGRKNFSTRLIRQFGVKEEHLPEVIRSTDVVGYITPGAAEEMGLVAGTPVFGGGGDASCIPIGSGYTQAGMTHVYIGTSGWVSTVHRKRLLDPIRMIPTLYGAEEGLFNYHAEMNAAGKCYEWARDHIALDVDRVINVDSGVFLQDIQVYERLSHAAMQAGIGSGGIIFTPWLAGERCPFSAAKPCGMFFNLGLKTDKTALIRSVLEGICYHINWMIEGQEKMLRTSPVLRFVGGGSLSPVTCQMLADITGKQVETIPCGHNAGAAGAAVIAAVGLGVIADFASAKDYIPVANTYTPDPKNHALYAEYYKVFKKLHPASRKLSDQLHRIGVEDHECI